MRRHYYVCKYFFYLKTNIMKKNYQSKNKLYQKISKA